MPSFVVSLRSRGLAAFSKARCLDWRLHVLNIFHDCLDVIISVILSAFSLSWSGWISLVIFIITVTLQFGEVTVDEIADRYFFNKTYTYADGAIIHVVTMDLKRETSAGAISLFLPCFFFVVLPLIQLVSIVLRRRDVAASALGKMKAKAVSVCLSASTVRAPEGSAELGEAAVAVTAGVFILMDDVHMYLQHRRPYARHFFFPYLSDAPSVGDSSLYTVSHELGVLQRKVHRAVKSVHEAAHAMLQAGAREALVLELVDKITEMHQHVEHLSCIKEMRTPLLLRCSIRWNTVLMIPVTMGYYWRAAEHNLHIQSLEIFFGIMMQMALMALFDVLISFEDPFNDLSLDTLSLLEVLDHISVMTDPEESYDTSDPWSDFKDSGATNQHTTVTVELMPGGAANPTGQLAGKEGDRTNSSLQRPGAVVVTEQVAMQGRKPNRKYKPEAVISAAGAAVPPMPPMPPMTSMGGGDL